MRTDGWGTTDGTVGGIAGRFERREAGIPGYLKEKYKNRRGPNVMREHARFQK